MLLARRRGGGPGRPAIKVSDRCCRRKLQRKNNPAIGRIVRGLMPRFLETEIDAQADEIHIRLDHSVLQFQSAVFPNLQPPPMPIDAPVSVPEMLAPGTVTFTSSFNTPILPLK